MTLKRRVMLALVALVAVFTMLLGALAVLSLHEQEDELVDELVALEARRLALRLDKGGPALLQGDDPLVLADHYQAWWLGPDGAGVPAPLPERLARLPDGPHRDALGPARHLIVMPAAGGRLFLAYDATRNDSQVRQFGWQVAWLALLFVGLAALAARLLADALVAPLARVARLLDHWAPASDAAADAPPEADEEHRLLNAFRRVQARWERGLAREREALDNLRHELRTPLTALRTDLEMLQVSGGLATDAARQRGQRALAAVDAVAGALTSMRALSAREAASPQAVPLADCVDDAWASLGELPAQRGLVLVNAVAPGVQVWADRHALMTILRNLVRNAAEHAAPARCQVHFEQGRLSVEDDGPGIPADELPQVFDRYHRGRRVDTPQPAVGATDDDDDGERGLGLAIARQVAEIQGWRLGVTAVQPHGSCFVLTLDPV